MSLYSAVVEHAKSRAAERYQVVLNHAKYWELVEKITHGEARRILRVSNTRSIFEVDGMVAVYSKSLHRIITFLPPDCREVQNLPPEANE